MAAIGNAVFRFFADDAGSNLCILDLGQALTTYDCLPLPEVADARTMGGRVQRSLGRFTHRIDLTIERIRDVGSTDRKRTARKLEVLRRALQKRKTVSFSADANRARAVFVDSIAAGDTALAINADPFATVLPGSLSSGDYVRLLTEGADGEEEIVPLSSSVAPTSSVLTLEESTITSMSGPVLAAWEYCWPALYRPQEDLPNQMIPTIKGRAWSLKLTLYTDLYATFRAAQYTANSLFEGGLRWADLGAEPTSASDDALTQNELLGVRMGPGDGLFQRLDTFDFKDGR